MSDELVKYDDGFGTPDRRNSPIKGTLVKFGVDGVWKTKDGLTVDPDLKLVAMGTTTIIQCWQDKMPVDTIYETPGQPLPDVDELNAQIPRNEWPIGVNGEPQGPWQLQRLLYLLDPATANKFTFATGTIGGAIAISKLKECVTDYRRLQGEGVCAVVTLANAPFKTKYGMKVRPSLRIVGWHHFGNGGGGQSALLPTSNGNGTAQPTFKEELNDSIEY
jgi:hypothetical protein